MSKTNTIYLTKGHQLTLTTDDVSSGKYVYINNPGESYENPVVIAESSIELVGPFNEGRSYALVSDKGTINYSSTCSGIYTKNDETNVSNYLTRVDALDDLPVPINGVITLDGDKAYHFTRDIDLLGSRLVGGHNTAILGTSSETSSITSTGLGVGVALFTTTGTTPIQNISFTDVDTALDINGDGTIALDWLALNIINVPNIGVIKNFTNWVISSCAFLNSSGLVFDGDAGTIGASNCLFTGDGESTNMVEVADTANITRRFRFIYSSFVIPTNNTAIDIDTGATIPVEGYILDTVNFSGAGSSTAGVTFSDNKSKFIECKGVTNSANISSYNMSSNSTETTITVSGTAVKVAGTTTEGSVTQRFTHTNNKLVFDGAITRNFLITATASLSSGNNNEIALTVSKNGTLVSSSEVTATTNAGGRVESVAIQDIIELEEDDYIEMWVANDTGTSNVTVEYLNVIITSLN